MTVDYRALPFHLRRAAAASGRVAACAALVATLAAGCAQGSGSPSAPATPPTPSASATPVGPPTPVGSPAPSPSTSLAPSPAPSSGPATPPATRPLTADEAVALVLTSDSRFAGMRPRDIGLIGQSAWYEIRPAGAGYVVTVSIGWGDCPAGCIERRTWVYSVSENGAVELVSTSGDDGPPADGTPGTPGSGGGSGDSGGSGGSGGGSGGSGGGSGGAASTPPSAAGTGTVAGMVLAGPVCPVVKSPPDPACADRPVVGAVVVALDASGREVARASSGADGRYRISLPPGTYTLVPQPVVGLMGTASTLTVEVRSGGTTVADLAYDTGIR